jgi:hypothetical protein
MVAAIWHSVEDHSGCSVVWIADIRHMFIWPADGLHHFTQAIGGWCERIHTQITSACKPRGDKTINSNLEPYRPLQPSLSLFSHNLEILSPIFPPESWDRGREETAFEGRLAKRSGVSSTLIGIWRSKT